jgi:demethylmenaquinone methyltransferase/2-methoxy-6-polyprenyl-1,4-benzoquinol methylase
MSDTQTTHFGYQRILTDEKVKRVGAVFSSVASRYDLMNDVMSMGVHRLWKRYTVYLSGVHEGHHILDVAGGTGDIALLFAREVGSSGSITVCDINADMLQHGRDKFIDAGVLQGVDFVQGNAECLPFRKNNFNCISIAFGLRNVTDKMAAITSMYDKLKYGGRIIILEFSSVVIPLLKKLYDVYSFRLIPWFGKVVADDEASYQYLVESIRMHPDQEKLVSMLETAGFCKVDYLNLSGGIVAIHRGFKI